MLRKINKSLILGNCVAFIWALLVSVPVLSMYQKPSQSWFTTAQLSTQGVDGTPYGQVTDQTRCTRQIENLLNKARYTIVHPGPHVSLNIIPDVPQAGLKHVQKTDEHESNGAVALFKSKFLEKYNDLIGKTYPIFSIRLYGPCYDSAQSDDNGHVPPVSVTIYSCNQSNQSPAPAPQAHTLHPPLLQQIHEIISKKDRLHADVMNYLNVLELVASQKSYHDAQKIRSQIAEFQSDVEIIVSLFNVKTSVVYNNQLLQQLKDLYNRLTGYAMAVWQ